ncbi:unnamed protein product [Thelazia callipaeda]|uniref:EB domain-containing protein n=1 Tax=Thelazia callipaeda TaxID=103827 RepID=A0A0N5CYC1_THECL|nr:unnamed protein product [Thelazia callipaeda]
MTDQCSPLAPRNPFISDHKLLDDLNNTLRCLLWKKEKDDSNKSEGFYQDYNASRSLKDSSMELVLKNERKATVNDCMNNIKCSISTDCGREGRCVYGKCRCQCIHKAPCATKNDCFGGTCNNACTKYAAFVHDECGSKDECANGTQCLTGVCVGGGRLRDGLYDAVSCTPTTVKSDCEGYGTGLCAMFANACIRHKDPSQLGLRANGIICAGGISASLGFPTCINEKGNATTCVMGNTCMFGMHCGSCSCAGL